MSDLINNAKEQEIFHLRLKNHKNWKRSWFCYLEPIDYLETEQGMAVDKISYAYQFRDKDHANNFKEMHDKHDYFEVVEINE